MEEDAQTLVRNPESFPIPRLLASHAVAFISASLVRRSRPSSGRGRARSAHPGRHDPLGP